MPKVCEAKQWKPVTNNFNLPHTATSASNAFKGHFERLLRAYEL